MTHKALRCGIVLVVLVLGLGFMQCATRPATPLAGGDDQMTNDMLEQSIEQVAGEFEISGNVMQFTFNNVQMVCIYDVGRNRMRLVAPIAPSSDITSQQFDIAMEANYHTALDGRYATSNGVLYAAFIHPLNALRKPELMSALRQIASLVSTFGTTYTSGELIFGPPSDDPQGPDA